MWLNAFCLYLSERRVTLRTVARGEPALSQIMWWSLMWVCSQHCWWPALCSSSSVACRWSTASSAASVEPAKRKGWETVEKQKSGKWGMQKEWWHKLVLIHQCDFFFISTKHVQNNSFHRLWFFYFNQKKRIYVGYIYKTLLSYYISFVLN